MNPSPSSDPVMCRYQAVMADLVVHNRNFAIHPDLFRWIRSERIVEHLARMRMHEHDQGD